MILNESYLLQRLNEHNKYIKNDEMFIVILNHLFVKLNKDGTYPKNPFKNLVLDNCKELVSKTKLMGYKHFLLQHKGHYYCVWFYKESDVFSVKYSWCEADGTTHGGTDGYFVVDLKHLQSPQTFIDFIDKKIKYYEHEIVIDTHKQKDFKNVYKQLLKIDTGTLSSWEVKELL